MPYRLQLGTDRRHFENLFVEVWRDDYHLGDIYLDGEAIVFNMYGSTPPHDLSALITVLTTAFEKLQEILEVKREHRNGG